MLLFAQRTLLRDGCDTCCFKLRVFIRGGLLFAHGHEAVLVGAPGEFVFDIAFAASQHERAHAFVQFAQVAIGIRAAFVIKVVELAVEPEERAEDFGVEEIDERIQFVDAVLQRRAGEHEGEGAAQQFDRARGARRPVLDALCFVEHHDVGREAFVDVEHIAAHLLVIHQRKHRRVLCVVSRPLAASAIDDLIVERGELANLLLPFGLQRCGRDHEHALRPAQPVQQRTRGNGLDGFPQAHLVGQHRAPLEGEVQHAVALIRIQWHQRDLRGSSSADDGLLVVAAQRDPLILLATALQPARNEMRDAQGSTTKRGENAERIFHRNVRRQRAVLAK